MKPKNLVSLFVAVLFLVLSVTGLLIYFGQGSHLVDHTHAWFGVLFVGAAVFHIVNNWSSLAAYTKHRRTGRLQKEFIVPAIVAAVFAAGIGFDLPVFSQLANAGKNLMRGDKPRGGPLSQQAVDSIAHAVETTYASAYSQGDTAALAAVLPLKTSVLTEAGTILRGSDVQKNLVNRTVRETIKSSINRAESLDDHTIAVQGSLTSTVTPSPSVYTHILKEQDKTWRIVAAQRAYPSVQ